MTLQSPMAIFYFNSKLLNNNILHGGGISYQVVRYNNIVFHNRVQRYKENQ